MLKTVYFNVELQMQLTVHYKIISVTYVEGQNIRVIHGKHFLYRIPIKILYMFWLIHKYFLSSCYSTLMTSLCTLKLLNFLTTQKAWSGLLLGL